MILGALVIIVTGVLVVNYFRDQKEGSVALSGQQNQEVSQNEIGGTYEVKQGDNLWSISENEYGSGYNWTDIAQANNISNPNIVSVGQELVIPDVQPKQVTQNTVSDQVTQADQAQSQPQSITGATYDVQHGDNLWDIAVRAYGDGYRWVDIAKENNLANPDLIHSGNVLVLPR